MYEHNPQHVSTKIVVKVNRFVNEIVDSGYGLDAGKTPAGYDEREQWAPHCSCAFRVRLFEMRYQPISEVDRIPQGLHRQRPLFESGKIEKVCDGTEPDDKVIVWKLMMVMVKSVRHSDELPLQIDRFNFSREKADPPQELSYGIHDVREIEVAGGNLVQHGSKQKEIVPVHQRDLDIGIAGQSDIQMDGGVQPGKAAAENEDSSFLLLSHRIPFQRNLQLSHLAKNLDRAVRVRELIE